MFKSVAVKLWATIFALILGILFVFSIFLSYRLEAIYFSNQVRLMTDNAHQWRTILTSGMPPESIQGEMEFWGRVSQYKITVFDNEGIVRYSSDPAHSPIGEKSNWTHVRAGIENREPYYTGYDHGLDVEMTATFLPFIKEGNQYVIMLHAPTDDLMEMNEATRRTGFEVLLFFLGISAILGWYFSHLITKPLIDIRKVAMGMAKGDFSTLAVNDRADELGDLAKTINILSLRLNKTLANLSKTNAELHTLLEKWKEFVADVSHELRTPLFLVQSYSEALLDGIVREEPSKKEYLGVINKESLRLQKMVNDLLAVESGLPLRKSPTDLYQLAKNTIIPFEIIAREKLVDLDVSEKLQLLPLISVDPDKIGEALYNLVDNALRYTSSGSVIISGELMEPDRVKLIISDSGIGFSPEHIPKIFDRFYRIDKARSRTQGGIGLGLAIVKKTIEQHGGTIAVESDVGRGTTFTIILPVK